MSEEPNQWTHSIWFEESLGESLGSQILALLFALVLMLGCSQRGDAVPVSPLE